MLLMLISIITTIIVIPFRLANWLFWWTVAKIVSRPVVIRWLFTRAVKRPYKHIQSADGTDTYMFRFWLFNPYPHGHDGRGGPGYIDWLPSARLHRIMRADRDRHDHDHPWDARTIILENGYAERRGDRNYVRKAGDTSTLLFGEYHRITAILNPPGGTNQGALTLFITWKYRGVWGFLVDGVKVPWRTYLGVPESTEG